MCKIRIISSSSAGNCYLLMANKEVLILDAGVPFKDVKVALNFNIRQISGVLVTHSHGDHAKYAHEYEAAGIPVWKPYKMENLRQRRRMGRFTAQSFPVTHSVPTVGYLIEHGDFGRVLYVTDAEYIQFRFRNLRTILIEMNYSNDYIDREAAKFAHVVQGHMEKQTTLDFLKANAGPELRHVVLCHLSRDGADPVEFKEAVRKIVPSGVTVDIAVPGGEVDLREIPF